ncbi:TolC family protein [Candidatus Dependentiae bacterium]|nr:TolC family protein [Candidatus Dependentiae bacterium]
MSRYSILLLFFLLPGCTQVKIGSEFSELRKKTIALTGSSITLDNTVQTHSAIIPWGKEETEREWSRDDVVSRALQNNPGLLADFQSIGIAKADLIQAGLYTNPTINSVFRFPIHERGSDSAQTNIETIAAFRLSDMWQVPLSKTVAQDVLEIVTLTILSKILDNVAETKVAYETAVAAELQQYNSTLLLNAIKELKDEIGYRQLYGYTTNLDKYLADARVSSFTSELQQGEAAIHTAHQNLKKLMGIPLLRSLNLKKSLYDDITLPQLAELQDYALYNRPEIQISRMKIQQYKDTLALEKTKIFKAVDIGIGYKKDFEKPFEGVGPYIDIQVPLFDDNYAQVARAEFLLKQAEKEYIKEKNQVYEEIRTSYRVIEALKKEIGLYVTKIIPSYERAIDYSYSYAQTMQLNMVNAVESKIYYYQAHEQLIDKRFRLMRELARLERALGKNLILFTTSNKGDG